MPGMQAVEITRTAANNGRMAITFDPAGNQRGRLMTGPVILHEDYSSLRLSWIIARVKRNIERELKARDGA
jgi:hypothetical protein